MNYEHWFRTVWDVLQADDEACLGLIRSAGGRAGEVALVEGDLETGDALAYARTLCEIGRLGEARDIFAQVMAVAFGMTAVADLIA